jgi:hypothetical protein
VISAAPLPLGFGAETISFSWEHLAAQESGVCALCSGLFSGVNRFYVTPEKNSKS